MRRGAIRNEREILLIRSKVERNACRLLRAAPKRVEDARDYRTRAPERARRLISEADDKAIVDEIVRDAKASNPAALTLYFRYLRPPLSRTTSVWPIDLEPPKSAQEAKDAIAKLTAAPLRRSRDQRG